MTDACTVARRLHASVHNPVTVAAAAAQKAAAYTLQIDGDACKPYMRNRQRQIGRFGDGVR